MKKRLIAVMSLVLIFSLSFGGMIAAETETSANTNPEFIDWFNESFNWMTVENGSWSHDPADQISDEELEIILDMAMKQQTAVHWTPYFMIAVTDVEEQRKILGDMWDDPENVATEGTVTVLVLADQILSQEEGHVSEYKDYYMQVPHYAYYDSGQASALMSVAANALGYSTHYFGSINGEYAPFDITGVNEETGEEYAYQSMDRYVKDEYMRTWGFMNPFDGEVNEDYVYPVKGNAVFVCAIVIGKPAADETVESWGTNHARPKNWAIWEE